MTDTPHLALPLLAAAQAQKHVTHNEALACLDALVQLAVIESGRDTPPGAPGEGDRYLVGAAPSGVFAGQAGRLAWFDAGAWRFPAPRAGWSAYVADEDRIVVFDGTAWRDLGHYGRTLDAVESLGIGTAPDPLNRLAAKLNAALFTAREAAAGGTGDLRVVLNKEAAAGTVSQLYQSGYSGRAEVGLIGDDDFAVKVSADGAAWTEALRIGGASGDLSAGRTSLSHPSGGTLFVSSGADGACLVLERSGVAVGSIAVSATGTTYNTTSDRRLKTDFQPVAGAGPVIDALRVGSFGWANDPEERSSLGLLAQEAVQVAPDAVLPGDDDPDARPGDPGFRAWGVDYSRLVPHLIAETQSLRRRVAALEAANPSD